MKKITVLILIALLVIVSIVTTSKFLGSKTQQTQQTQQTQLTQATKYWTCGMHPSVRVTDEEYKKGKINCPICNMPLIPLEEEKVPTQEIQQTQVTQETYYGCGVKEEGHCPRCDRGLEDAQCICGQHSFMIKGQKMNCPVCGKALEKIEPKDLGAVVEKNIISSVTLKGAQIELAGIKTEPVRRYHLTKRIRTVGKIAFDPELAVAQEEFLTAVETKQKIKDSPDPDVIKRADELVEKSKFKLRLLGMSDDEITELKKEGTTQLNLVLPGNKAWVYADVYEYELAWVKAGQAVLITLTSYPGEEFKGVVKSISPVLDPRTRSAKLRIETDNIEQKLKPEMYVDVVIESMYQAEDGSHQVLSIPKDAVLDTGIRKVVYVDAGGGKFLGKEIKTGPETTAEIDGQKINMYPVLSGLSEGEIIVIKGNFLIDSQSQITGTAATVYGGAISGPEEQKMPPEHKH